MGHENEDRQTPCEAMDARKGFAFDKFKPGQVSYQGTSYNRIDILLLHHKLIEKARKAFNTHIIQGAELKSSPKSPKIRDSIQRQPSATGGSRARRQKADQDKMQTDSLEASSHLHDTGSLQPAGAQCQPQALGSRGFVGANFGQAEPRSDYDAETLRLPDIAVVGGPTAEFQIQPVLKLPEIAGSNGKNVVGKALTAR